MGDNACLARHPTTRRPCLRPEGHEGDHQHPDASTWPRETAPRAQVDKALATARAEEREACAQLVDRIAESVDPFDRATDWVRELVGGIASDIRARGEADRG